MKITLSKNLNHDMAKLKIILPETKFDRTCELIYSLASKRVKAKYKEWQDKNKSLGLSASRVDFSDNQYIQKSVGRIMNNKKTDENPYLINTDILPILKKNLNFHDENEILWGDNAELYLEDLFVSLLLDMKIYPEYFKHWDSFNLHNETDFRNFYKENIVDISNNFDRLVDGFIDFTYNAHIKFKIVENHGVVEIAKQRVNEGIIGRISKERQKQELNNTDFLSFYELPEKVKVLAENVILPLIDNIRLADVLD